MKQCKNCNNEFEAKSSIHIYCNKEIIVLCSCGKTRNTVCGKRYKKVYLCHTCQSKNNLVSTRQKQQQTLLAKHGVINPGQIYAKNRGRNNNVKATLLKKHPNIKNIDEYMEIRNGSTEWFLKFYEKNSRKPTQKDLNSYFGVTPRRLLPDQKNLMLVGKNYYEIKIKEYLLELSPDLKYKHRTRPIIVTPDSYLYKEIAKGSGKYT